MIFLFNFFTIKILRVFETACFSSHSKMTKREVARSLIPYKCQGKMSQNDKKEDE